MSQQFTPFQTTTVTYDSKNRVATRADLRGGLTWTSSYQYDDRGNLTQVAYADTGRVVVYTYDAANRLTGATQNGTPYASSFIYDDSGRVTSYQTGPVSHTASYDTADRIQHLAAGGSSGLDLTYAYNPGGQVTGITDPQPGASQSFLYNSLDRLTGADGPWGRRDWTYDKAGNRLTQALGGTTSYSYDQPTQRLVTTTGTAPESFSYNATGQLTADSRGAYTYNGAGLLSSAISPTVAATYGYDADDLRTAHLVNGQTTYTVRGSGGQIFERVPGRLHDRGLVARPALRGRAIGRRRQGAAHHAHGGADHGRPVGGRGRGDRRDWPPADHAGWRRPGLRRHGQLPHDRGHGAEREQDFTASASTVVFAAGSPNGATPTISIPIANDTLDEDDETFTVNLSTVTGGTLLARQPRRSLFWMTIPRRRCRPAR